MVDTMQIRNGERELTVSSEISETLENLKNLELAERAPERLQPLLNYLTSKMADTLTKLEGKGSKISVYGPDWCRANPEIAGKAHAEVIVQTYGDTYALPNKYPDANVNALAQGDLDMYLMFEDDRPVGTCCLVVGDNNWAELGRSASLGGVGNSLIQDLRIVRWLTDPDQAEKIVGLFTTCRTAPDRNVGTEDEPSTMRGGQAVTHMWSQFPSIMVGGFGPLYKKHGKLEQFAYTFITNRTTVVPERLSIVGEEAMDFVKNWTQEYYPLIDSLGTPGSGEQIREVRFHAEYPPVSTGLTEFIHGEVQVEPVDGEGEDINDGLDRALKELEEAQVPFIQVPVPVDFSTIQIQHALLRKGFIPFIFVPGIQETGQSPKLWYGKVTEGIKVVPTFWDEASDFTGEIENPFWPNRRLSRFALSTYKKW
jgi:hypothetical protein